MLNVRCFPSSPCSAELPVEFSVPWTEQASKHCWDTSPVKEPPSRQLGQVLSFRPRQLHVLIHLFCSAVPRHMFLLGWLSSSLCHCSSHAVCDAPSLQCSGAEEQHLALSPGHSLLSTQTSALWVMGELPAAGPWGRMVNLSANE